MSAPPRMLEPNRSVLDFFGAELRHRRTAAGLSYAALARQVFVTADMVGKVEAGLRFPSLDLAQRADDLLHADGALVRLHGLAVAERQRQRAQRAGLGCVEMAQLRRLLAAIDLIPAGRPGSSGLGVLDRIDDVIAQTTALRTW